MELFSADLENLYSMRLGKGKLFGSKESFFRPELNVLTGQLHTHTKSFQNE